MREETLKNANHVTPISTSSLWAVFVNKNRCISVLFSLVSEKNKRKMFLIILIIHKIVSYDQNSSYIFFVTMDSMSGCDIRLVFTLPPGDSTL